MGAVAGAAVRGWLEGVQRAVDAVAGVGVGVRRPVSCCWGWRGPMAPCRRRAETKVDQAACCCPVQKALWMDPARH